MHPLIVKILRMILLFAAAFLLLFAFVGFFMGDFLISLMFALPGAYLIYLVIIKPRREQTVDSIAKKEIVKNTSDPEVQPEIMEYNNVAEQNEIIEENNQDIIPLEHIENSLIDPPIVSVVEPEKPKPKTLSLYVAGTQHNNDKGKSIQKILKNYIKENYDSNDFSYWTNKELIESDYDIWEYDLSETNTVTFIPDPGNDYDKTAIKIIHKEMGRVGFVPRKLKKDFNQFIKECPNFETNLIFRGGRHKYVDYDDEDDDYPWNYEDVKLVVKTETKPYYLDVELIEIIE